ncbi:MAG: MinD/ParA family protein [bacterium]|nr:MinD/ParA family protein [bacterium]
MADQAQGLRELAREKNVGNDGNGSGEKPNSSCRILTVTSGKGGVGKTNIAANLAIAFAQAGRQTLIMDADLGLANVNVILGLIPPPKYNLSHVVGGKKKIQEIITNGPAGIRLIAGATGVTEVANLSQDERDEFVLGLSSLADSIDYLIFDTGAGLSPNVLSFVLAADEIILVTTPEPTAIADAYGMVKAVCHHNIEANIKLVVNRVSSVIEGKKVADRIVNIAGQFLNIRVEVLGYILEDNLVIKSVRQQKPFFLAYPRSKAAYGVAHIMAKLIQSPETEPGNGNGLHGFFKRLLGS